MASLTIARIVLSALHILRPMSTIPLVDLDSEGYPKDFEIDSYACDGHYWFRDKWHNGKRRYMLDPPSRANDDRYLQWGSNNNWVCFKPQNNAYFTRCQLSNLFDCNVNIAIRYEIIENQCEGFYRRNGTDTNGNNYYHREILPLLVIFYDVDTFEWRISDEYNGDIVYATCSSLNFFECEWVQTGATANPTYASTASPTTHTTIAPSVTPTKRPMLQVIISKKPSTNTVTPSSYKHTISTYIMTQTIGDNDVYSSDNERIQVIMCIMVSILCCCMLCVVYVCGIWYKSNMNKVEQKQMNVNVVSLTDEKLPQSHHRVHTISEVQLYEGEIYETDKGNNGNDAKINDDCSEKSDINENHSVERTSCEGNGAITDPGMQIDERLKERSKQQRAEFKQWLTETVRLPQYYDVLLQNGYESLGIIKEVTDKDELNAIGIVLKRHRLKLMQEIKRLQS